MRTAKPVSGTNGGGVESCSAFGQGACGGKCLLDTLRESRRTMFDYKSAKWERIKSFVLRRDGYKCQLSKRYGKNIPAEVVHHIYPFEEYPEYAYCTWNLIALSRAAHNRLHDRNTNTLTDEGIALQRRTKRP